jgi:hypothetical protein
MPIPKNHVLPAALVLSVVSVALAGWALMLWQFVGAVSRLAAERYPFANVEAPEDGPPAEGEVVAMPPADVKPAELVQLVERADKIIVLERPAVGAKVLFQSSDRKDLDAFKAALKLQAPDGFCHCKCDGTPAIQLYANGEEIGLITNHHGILLRCNLWQSDASISDPERFLTWFDKRNIKAPRSEYERTSVSKKKARQHRQKWLAAMPPALKPHIYGLQAQWDPDLAPAQQALKEAIPDQNERILALFSWFGSGAGPWSGFPSYESIAEKLLMGYSTRQLLTAVEDRELTPAQMEGAARLFGGWEFSRERSSELRLLPADLKRQLLEHSLVNADEDKRARARQAFDAR